jgi:NitT/TauT family transport system substrate-binding protein
VAIATTAKTTTVANVAKSNQAKAPIKILYSAGLCGIPIHIAKQLQFLEAEGFVEGVDYQYVTLSTSGVEMLSTKQADISFGMLSAMLAPLDNGLEAKTVLGVHTGCVQVLGSTSSGVKSIKDLKGKKIGVQQLASSTHVVIQ